MNDQPDNRSAAPPNADQRGLHDVENRQYRKRRAALLAIGCNSALVSAKLGVGILSGSVGVLSEAVHSGTDLVASIIAFLSVRASDTPPDAEHPFGHGKIEGVSGLIEALLIGLAGCYIIYEAVMKLVNRHAPAPAVDAGLAAMAVSAIVSFLLSRHLSRVAAETDSLALQADAEHIGADVRTSVGVFIGLALVRVTHLTWLDPAAGICVALLVLFTAYTVARHAMQPLLDARLPPEEELRIKNILDNDARVLGYHKLRTRKSGSQRHADVHVLLNDDSTLLEAHALAEELEDEIRITLPDIQINIHIEPYHAEMRHQREAHGLSMEQANPKSAAEPRSGRAGSRTEAP
ncbi:MAG TPA: cation diffusion facilitator family transporter [Chthonomonadaceae bacterium]|nr:cation diffusion facilitator family transporter [Chthonomonadaceae bacterium]